METSKSSLLVPLFSFLSFLLLLTPSESAHHIPDDFPKCLESQNSSSISQFVFTPKNSSYESILQSSAYNLRPLSSFPFIPTIILTPSHESQIQAAIYCAKTLGIQIRVRSGGHDYEGLSFSSEVPFVMVDLRNLKSISIDKENHKATIQAGATLGELYHKIAEKSRTLAFVAGVGPTVGVGGHFSGGGYSMMSRRFGIAADHIVDAEIIDVNGLILDRKSMGEDLFWAIRGGSGAAFGIITEWTVNLLTVPKYVTVFNVSRTLEQNATQLVHKWQYIADKIDENLEITISIRTAISQESQKKTIEVSFPSLFLGEVDDLLKLMHQSFPELGLRKENCQEMGWIQSILYFALLPIDKPDALLNRTQPQHPYFKGKSDYVQQPISETGLEGIWEILLEEDVGRAEVQFIPYGGRMNNISESTIPFPHRAGNIFMIPYYVGWSGEENSESTRYMNWIRRLYSYMAKYVSKSPRAAYVNYKDLDLGVNNVLGDNNYRQARVWGTKYFKNNFDRLVDVKSQVDPNNFFRNEQSIPPLAEAVLELQHWGPRIYTSRPNYFRHPHPKFASGHKGKNSPD